VKSKIYQTLEEARCALLKKLNTWTASTEKPGTANSKIVRLEVAVENAHPLEWLTLQDCDRKVFFGKIAVKQNSLPELVLHLRLKTAKMVTKKYY